MAVLASAGCEMLGTSGGIDLADFLGRPRGRRREFCAGLSDTAPVEGGAEVRDAAPMVERRLGPGKRSTTHVLWPFFSSSRTPDERSFALRPLIAAETRPGEKRVEFLWPIASYTRRGEDRTLKVRPLFSYKRRVRGGAEREHDTDWFLLPFLFGGRDTREGGYFAFFPIAGTLKGIFGKKKMSFFLFPLWLKTVDKRYNSINLMWPFAAYWKGKDQSGRRLWPFFGGNSREGRFDRRWYLWPIISTWKVGLDTKVPGKAFFVFPFYGRTKNYVKENPDEPFLQKTTVLFPFFHRVSQRRVVDKQNLRNLDEVQAPWPCLGYTRGEGLATRKLWPFYGERKSNDFRKRFFLWRMYVWSITHDEDAEYRWRNIGFLYTDQVDRWVVKNGRSYPPPWPEKMGRMPDPRIAAGLHTPYETKEGEIRSRRWTQLWPLWHYRRDEKGEVQFQALSLLPRKAAGRAETLWRPFYTLYRYERDKVNGNRQSALFGLYRYASRRNSPEKPGLRYVNVAGITSYHRRTGVGKRWSILGGLVGYERVGDRRAYRFLWAPFGRIPREVREKYAGAQQLPE